MPMYLESNLRLLYGAYEYLREHDLAAQSTTSRLLHERDLAVLAGRVADELAELRGTVAGTHGHGGGRDDVVLEAYQSLYWLIVLAVAAGDRYDDLQPHEAMIPLSSSGAAHDYWRGDEGVRSGEGDEWAWLDDPRQRHAAIRQGVSLVAAECSHGGVDVAEAVARDLRELRSKPYLQPYWDAPSSRITI